MKTKHTSTLFVIALLMTVLTVGSCRKGQFNPFVIDTLPEFSVIMDNGETVNTLTIYGTTTVICTFNTGDDRSMKMLSMLQPVYEQFRRKAKFVTISDGEPEEDILECWERHAFSLPFSAQEDATQARKFSKDVPYIMVIDSSMKIVGTFGRDNLPTRADIESLIAGSSK